MDNFSNETQEQVSEPTEQVEQVEQAQVEPEGGQSDKSDKSDKSDRPQKESRYEKLNKSYSELRSFSDRRYQESQKQMESMRKELEYFSPYKDALTKALDDKKRAEMEGLYQSNPMEAQRRMAEEIAQKKIAEMQQQYAPLQQKMEAMENKEATDNVVNYLQTNYGDSAFNAMKPVMANLLGEVHQNQGPDAANLLARNPDALMQMAVGRAYMENVRQGQQQKQVGQQNQNKAVQFAKGTARPQGQTQKQVSGYDGMSDTELEKLAYAELMKQYGK